MKKCSKCGAEIKDDAKFCKICGQPCADTMNTAGVSSQSTAGYGLYTPPPITTGGWIGRMLALSIISLIPFIGQIAYIVILVVWSQDRTKEETFRNWAKAQIVVMIIMFVIFLILLMLVFIPFFEYNSIRI